MARLLHPLLMMLASSTKRQLAAQIQYLKAGNEILRSKLLRRVTVTDAERQRLVKLGRKAGKAIKELISIVTYRTFQRWVAISRGPASKPVTKRKPGRPRTSEETHQIVLRLARENDWGFTRLWGELRKLGIHIGKTTLRNILKEHGIDPGPKRMAGGTWDEFIKRHAATLWQCDFLSKKVWSLTGKIDCYLLFFIHVASRRVWVSPATAHPTGTWVAQQARSFSMWAQEQELPVGIITRDRDTKFQDMFDVIFQAQGARVMTLPARAPNLNAYAERWVQSLQTECLDQFVVLGENHMDHLVSAYVAHYTSERPHQSKDNLPLTGDWSAPRSHGAILCRQRLGGLLRHYYRRAA